MTLTDYAAISQRLLDAPHEDELHQQILVCADALESAGDPRGALISLGHAARTATSRRLRELQAAMLEPASALLGPAAELAGWKRALALDWRAGRLYGAYFDTRHISRTSSRAADELVSLLLVAPAAVELRRLTVRVADPHAVDQVVRAIARGPVAGIEELYILRGVRPRTRLTMPPSSTTLLARLPNLYACALDDALHPIAIPDPPPPPATTKTKKPAKRPPPEPLAAKVERVRLGDPPDAAAPRALLGRAMFAMQAELQYAAIERLEYLGPAALVYLDAILVLLERGLAPPAMQTSLAALVGRFGPRAEPARLRLAAIAGHADYPVETRRAAGASELAIRTASA